MTAGYNPFAPDRRSREQRNQDAAEDFAELVLDEVIERMAKTDLCFQCGADVLAEAFTELLAGTDFEGKIYKRNRDIHEEQSAGREGDIRREAAE